MNEYSLKNGQEILNYDYNTLLSNAESTISQGQINIIENNLQSSKVEKSSLQMIDKPVKHKLKKNVSKNMSESFLPSPEIKIKKKSQISNKNIDYLFNDLKFIENSNIKLEENTSHVRKDFYGNEITKGKMKKHNISFIDKISKQNLAKVINVESHKESYLEQNKEKTNCNCACSIF